MLTQLVFILVQGKWIGSSGWNTIVDPLNGEPFIRVAEVNETEIQVLPLMSDLVFRRLKYYFLRLKTTHLDVLPLTSAHFFKSLLALTWWIAFAAICEESDQMP